MAVEIRYVVIRNGQEVMSTTDKKQADEYDRMLDMADALSELLEQSSLAMDEKQREELCIFLAKQREEVLIALQAKKAKASSSADNPKQDDAEDDNVAVLSKKAANA